MTFKQRFFIVLQYILPHHLLSRLVGKLAQSQVRWIKNSFIKFFIRRFNIDMSLALYETPDQYACFNDFFTRPLKEGVRPICSEPNSIACPADGAISQLGTIEHGRIFQAKGHSFSVSELLGGCNERATEFMGGSFCTVYLSPKDYHRVHMPLTGTLREMVYIPGKLFSVNQTTAENVSELFARNERLACIFDTEQGPMAVVLVGAMIVASIETVWAGQVTPYQRQISTTSYREQDQQPISLEKGAELGRFKLGSTAIILFGAQMAQWQESLTAGNTVNMGQMLGNTIPGTKEVS